MNVLHMHTHNIHMMTVFHVQSGKTSWCEWPSLFLYLLACIAQGISVSSLTGRNQRTSSSSSPKGNNTKILHLPLHWPRFSVSSSSHFSSSPLHYTASSCSSLPFWSFTRVFVSFGLWPSPICFSFSLPHSFLLPFLAALRSIRLPCCCPQVCVPVSPRDPSGAHQRCGPTRNQAPITKKGNQRRTRKKKSHTGKMSFFTSSISQLSFLFSRPTWTIKFFGHQKMTMLPTDVAIGPKPLSQGMCNTTKMANGPADFHKKMLPIGTNVLVDQQKYQVLIARPCGYRYTFKHIFSHQRASTRPFLSSPSWQQKGSSSSAA